MVTTKRTKKTGSTKQTKGTKKNLNSVVRKPKVPSSRKTRSGLLRYKTKEPSSEKRKDLHPINSFSKHDEWTDLYKKLLNSGWRWSSGASKLANYTYFNPGIKAIKDGKHGKDYFFSEEELKLYITNNYGWIGPQEDSPSKTSKRRKKLQSATSNTVLAKKELITKNEKKRKEAIKTYNTPLKKKSNNRLKTNDSEKNKPEEEKLNSTIDHFQNDRKKKSNVIKIKFESHELVISKGSKTKCGKIQININDQFLIGKSVAFLSNSFIGRKIKKLYSDDQFDDLSSCLSKHQTKSEYIYRCFIKQQKNNNTFEIDWRYQCNALFPFTLPRTLAIEGYNFYQNFIYDKQDDGRIEDEVIISDDFVDDEKTVTEKCPLICYDDEVKDKNQLLNKELAFHLDSFCAKAIAKYIKFDTKKMLYEFPKEVIVTVNDNKFISQCFVSSRHGTFFQVDWRYSCQGLFSFHLHEDLVHEGILCYEQIQLLNKKMFDENFDDESSVNSTNDLNNKKKDSTNYEIKNTVDDINEGADLFEKDMTTKSDESSEEEEDDDVFEAEDKVNSRLQLYGKLFMKEQRPEQEEISGLLWESNIELEEPNLMKRKKSKLKSEFKNYFYTPIDSLLAFLPYSFWENHLKETNRMADEFFKEKEIDGDSSRMMNGLKFKTIRIEELFQFYAIMIQAVVKPTPGTEIIECWRYPDYFSACKGMSVNRFRQIRKCLHWIEKNKTSRLQDTCYKVRPILNYLNLTLGRYIDPGESLAFDETTCPMRSNYAGNIISFDPTKPKGKFHIKFFTLCENTYGTAIKIHMCHRIFAQDYINHLEEKTKHFDKSIKESKIETIPADQTKEEKDFVKKYEEKDQDYYCSMIPLMLKEWNMRGHSVSMDRAYTSPKLFILLK